MSENTSVKIETLEDVIWNTIVDVGKALGHEVSDNHCEAIAEAVEDWASTIEEDAL